MAPDHWRDRFWNWICNLWFVPWHLLCGSIYGKLDGLAVFAGMFSGLILFAETEPFLNKAINYSSIGDISLYEVFNMNYGVLTFLITIIALGAFWIAGMIEERYNKKLS